MRTDVCSQHSQRIGVEISDVYDGVLFWACLNCGETWNPWPVGNPRRVVAERCMAEWGTR